MADETKPEPKNQIRAVPLEDVRRARGEVKIAMPRSKVASLRAFRRVRADRTLGALGILLLFVGIALIFSWEKPPVVEKKFGVEWPQNITREPPIIGANLAEGAPPRAHTFDFTREAGTNATAIIFTLLWQDRVGNQGIEADELELDVKGPAGVNVTNATIKQRAKDGNITIPLALNGIPEIASVNADNEAAARRAVGDRSNHTGIGQWTISVRVLRAPGDIKNEAARNPSTEAQFCNPQMPDNPTCTPDGVQDYQLQISYATYTLRLKKLF